MGRTLSIFMVFLAILVLLPLPCATQDAETAVSLLLLLSNNVEAQKLVGSLAGNQLEDESGVSTDPQLNERVNNVLARLAPAARREKMSFEVKVLNNSDVNAYALPGGKIYVNEGLLHTPGVTDAELAFVMGHELAHTREGHGFRQLRDSLVASLVAGKLIKGNDAKFIAGIAAQLYISGRSRADERAADQLGFSFAAKAGYNPYGGLAFMRRLETLATQDQNPYQQFFATHPPTSERSETLKSMMFTQKYGRDFMPLAGAGSTRVADTTAQPTDTFMPSAQGGFGSDWLEKCKHKVVEKHCGVDVDLQQADKEVRACATGVVRYADYFSKSQKSKWGKCIVIEHLLPDMTRFTSLYGHIVIDKSIKPGMTVEKGTLLGVIDKAVKPPHLHFGIRTGTYEDPKSRHGALAACGQDDDIPQFPERWVEPTAFLEAHGQALAGNMPARGEIMLLPDTIYLGDDRSEEETVWYDTFQLTPADLNGVTEAVVKLKVKAIPRKDPIVYFNRQKVGAAVARTDQWEEFTFRFSPGILHAGDNLVDLETFIPNLWQSYDDCEVKEVRLLLNNGGTQSEQPVTTTLLRGNLHIHTNISGGSVTWQPIDTLKKVNAVGLDVIGLSDHSEAIVDDWSYLEWLSSETLKDPNTYVIGLRGFEWTYCDDKNLLGASLEKPEFGHTYDHINIFGTREKWAPNNGLPVQQELSTCYEKLAAARQDRVFDNCPPVAQFNHIWTGTHFNNFAFNAAADDVIELIEVGGTPAYHSIKDSETLFRTALLNGWHVAPTIGNDNLIKLKDGAIERHTGIWLTGNDSGRSGVLNALYHRQVFATEDRAFSLKLLFDIDGGQTGNWMGSQIDLPANTGITLRYALSDGDRDNRIQKVEVVALDGRTIAVPDSAGQFDADGEFSLRATAITSMKRNALDEAVFYLRVILANGAYVLSAPIWLCNSTQSDAPVRTSAAVNVRPPLPAGYSIESQASADFDLDNVQETAYVLNAAGDDDRIPFNEDVPPTLILFARGGTVLGQYALPTFADCSTPITSLLTGDRKPTLLVCADPSFNGRLVQDYAFRWDGRAFTMIFPNGGISEDVTTGGALIEPQGAGQAAAILTYFIEFGENGEEGAYFLVETYHWQNGKYRKTAEQRTRRTYEMENAPAALAELGIDLKTCTRLQSLYYAGNAAE